MKKLIHVSDIHMRLLKRHDEYKIIFRDFFSYLEENDGAPVFCVGDVLHSKVELTAELIDLCHYFIDKVSDLTDLFILPGNHDVLLTNSQRAEPLEKIIKIINKRNVWYLNDVTPFEYGGAWIVPMPITKKKEEYVKAERLPDDGKPKIALYHGMLKNAKLDETRTVDFDLDASFFDGFDIVLMGDIHFRQKIQDWDAEKKKPAMAYAGSMIQQNHGEEFEHGFLLWDVGKRNFSFRRLKNEYSFFTFKIDENGKLIGNGELTSKPRIRIKHHNASRIVIEEALNWIKKVCEPSEITIENEEKFSSLIVENCDYDVKNLGDLNEQTKLIQEYCKINGIEEQEKLVEINEKIRKKIVFEKTERKTWTINAIKFSNMFSYGQDNFVNFNEFEGIVGLFSGNYTGKSSFLNALTYALFDKCDKTHRSIDVLNVQEKEFYVKLFLTSDGKKYVIEKSGKLEKDSLKTKLSFYGDDENLTGEQKKDTMAAIKQHIGEFDDFLLMSYSPQNLFKNFIELSQSERKDAIIRIFGLEIFEKQASVIEDDYKIATATLKKFDAEMTKKEAENYLEQIFIIKKRIEDLNAHKTNLEKKIEEIDEKIEEMTMQIKHIMTTGENAEDLEKKIKNLAEESKEKKIRIEAIDKEILALENEGVEKKLTEIRKKAEKLIGIEMEYKVALKEVTTLENKIDEEKRKNEKLLQLEYDPNCRYCMNNVFVKDAISSKEKLNELKKKKREAVEKLAEIEAKQEEHKKTNEELKYLLNSKAKLEGLRKEKEICEQRIKDIKEIAKEAAKKLEEIKMQKEAIILNEMINGKINELKKSKSEFKKAIEKTTEELLKKTNERARLEKDLEKKNEILNEIKRTEEIARLYGKYYRMMKRDGLPLFVIKKRIRLIEAMTKEILKEIADFALKFEVDEKSVEIYICRENKKWNISLCSGMEKFVSSVALRIALSRISSLPMPDFMIIDEGWAQIDQENAANLPKLFEFLRKNFRFVLLVSHNEFIKDMVDKVIKAYRDKNNYSRISA